MNSRQYALTGFSAAALFWLTYFAMASQRPGYSFLTKAVSELGSVDAPHKWVWNVLGYVTTGLLVSVFGHGLYKSVAPAGASKLPWVGILCSGLCMSLSGVFPGDFDNRQSWTMQLHTVGSVGSYLFFLLGAFTYPSQMRRSAYWASAVKPTLLCTWLTIAFGSWVFVVPRYPAVGQRMVFMFYFLWIVFNAYKLHKLKDHA